jgi:ATP-dependent helicase/nuclease subunit A
MVILADLAGRRNQGERFVVDRRNNEIAIRIGSKEAGIETMNYERLCEYEDLRREAEERRLLYVAMTRARDHVVIPAYFATPRELPKPGDTGPKSLFHYLVPKVPVPGAKGGEESVIGMQIFDSSTLDLDPEEPPTFRLPLDPDAPDPAEAEAACDRLEKWKSGHAEMISWSVRGRGLKTATEEKEVVPIGGPTQGALFGRLVHTLFERVDWESQARLEEVAASETRALGADPAMRRKAVEMVRTALDSNLMKRILRADRYFKEVPFAFKEGDHIVEGVIDVLFEEEGKIGILDFKTDKVPKSKLAAKVKEYGQQLETYREAVAAACGRPPHEAILFFLHPMEAIPVSPKTSTR